MLRSREMAFAKFKFLPPPPYKARLYNYILEVTIARGVLPPDRRLEYVNTFYKYKLYE